MLTNDEVNEQAYFAWRKAQAEAIKTERLGVIHVSDLIKPCMRYVMYGKLLPKEYQSMDTEDMKAFFIGQAIHKVTNLSTNPDFNELFLAYDYENDKPLTRKQALKIPQDSEKQLDIIYGSIDDIIELDGETILVDKKTTSNIDYFMRHNAKANDSHREQLNCYAALLQKCYKKTAKKGCNIYISSGISKDKRDVPIPITYNLGKPEVYMNMMITKARRIKNSILSNSLPERTRCFLCDGMCPFAERCFGEFGH